MNKQVVVFVLLVFMIFLVSCDDKPTEPNQVGYVSFTPSPGDYNESQNVSLSCNTPGANIHYTTDNSSPTASSQLYTNPINLTETTTIKAIAYKDGWTPSPVVSADYTINNDYIYLINDDFESYSLNLFPTESEWFIQYTGTGAEDQYISNLYSNSGEKSLRLSGTNSWRAEINCPIEILPEENIGYEVSFYANPNDPGGVFGFYNPNYGIWGTIIQGVRFYDNVVKFTNLDIYEFSDDSWVSIKLEYSQSNNRVNLWVNGDLFLEDHIVEENTVPITSIYISTRYGSGACTNFWDDVKVFKN